MRLLRSLVDAQRPLALSDLAAAAEMLPAQAYTYMVSLVRLGLAKRSLTGETYEAGPLGLRLGLLYLEQSAVCRAALPRAQQLADKLDCCVALCLPTPRGPTIVRYLRGGASLHVNLHPGTVLDLQGTSSGRVYCTWMPPTVWQGRTGKSAAFTRKLREIRERGFELSVDSPSPGVSSICAPVCNADAQFLLSLTLIGSTGSIDVHPGGRTVRALLSGCKDVAQQIQDRDGNDAH